MQIEFGAERTILLSKTELQNEPEISKESTPLIQTL
jgi:hypothetical protein